MEYSVTLRIEPDGTNEADPWVKPTTTEVVREIEAAMKGKDFDTGWTVVAVASNWSEPV